MSQLEVVQCRAEREEAERKLRECEAQVAWVDALLTDTRDLADHLRRFADSLEKVICS